MTRHDLIRAESDLSWFWEVCVTIIGLSAQGYDPDGFIGGGDGWEYTDRQMDAATRSLPIRARLRHLTHRQVKLLQLRWESRRCGPEEWLAYDFFAEIVRHFRPREDSKRLKLERAKAWYADALTAYLEAT